MKSSNSKVWLVIFLVVGLVGYGIFEFLVKPANNKVTTTKETTKTTLSETAQKKSQIKDLPLLQTRTQVAALAIAEQQNAFFGNLDDEKIFTRLQQLSTDIGVEWQALTIGEAVEIPLLQEEKVSNKASASPDPMQTLRDRINGIEPVATPTPMPVATPMPASSTSGTPAPTLEPTPAPKSSMVVLSKTVSFSVAQTTYDKAYQLISALKSMKGTVIIRTLNITSVTAGISLSMTFDILCLPRVFDAKDNELLPLSSLPPSSGNTFDVLAPQPSQSP